MKKIFSKMSIITFAIIITLAFVLLYYKENTTNIEAPKRATLVYLNDNYE
jgi:hypothetical protein